MIRCIAIDDEPLALRLIREYISRFDDITLLRSFDDGIQALDYLEKEDVDLLIIDINMPDINGLQLVERLRNRKPLIVFTTAYRDYAVEGFQLDAVDYILKPVTFERLETAIQKVRLRMPEPDEAGYLMVHSEYKLIKVPLREIEYIESLSDYVKIHLAGLPHPILSLNSLKALESTLPGNRFSRIHRSLIVSHAHIHSTRGKKVIMKSGLELPVSQSYNHFLLKWKGAP